MFFWIWLVGVVVTLIGLSATHIIMVHEGNEGLVSDGDEFAIVAVGVLWPAALIFLITISSWQGFKWLVIWGYEKVKGWKEAKEVEETEAIDGSEL